MKKAGKAVVLMTALAVTGALLGGCAGGTADSKTEAGRPKRERRKLVRTQRILLRRRLPGEIARKEM